MKRGVGFERESNGVPDDEPRCETFKIMGRHHRVDFCLKKAGNIVAILRDQLAGDLKCSAFVNGFHATSLAALDG